MMGLNSVPRGPVATAWLTAPDISGTGTAVVASDNMLHAIPGIEVGTDFEIQVEITLAKPSGTGQAHGWVSITSGQGDISVTAGNGGEGFNAGRAMAEFATPSTRMWRLRPSVFAQRANTGYDNGSFLNVVVSGKASGAGVEWAIAGIRSRLVYTPL